MYWWRHLCVCVCVCAVMCVGVRVCFPFNCLSKVTAARLAPSPSPFLIDPLTPASSSVHCSGLLSRCEGPFPPRLTTHASIARHYGSRWGYICSDFRGTLQECSSIVLFRSFVFQRLWILCFGGHYFDHAKYILTNSNEVWEIHPRCVSQLPWCLPCSLFLPLEV